MTAKVLEFSAANKIDDCLIQMLGSMKIPKIEGAEILEGKTFKEAVSLACDVIDGIANLDILKIDKAISDAFSVDELLKEIKKMETEQSEVMSVQDVARELGCSESTLYNKIQADQIPHQRINKKTCILFRRDLERIKMAIEPRSNSVAGKELTVKVELEHALKEISAVASLAGVIRDIHHRIVRLESKFHTVYGHVLPNDRYKEDGKSPTVGDMVKRSLTK